MSAVPVQITDRQAGRPADATLHTALTAAQLVATEAAWGPAREEAKQRLREAGRPEHQLPEHGHWDWALKSPYLASLAYRCFGIECQGRMQGLMMVTTAGHDAMAPPDVARPLVYVEFLESAPWNLKDYTPTPLFGAVGVRLFEAAVRLSVEEGFRGRVGLHSLPQSESFYRDVLRMTELGPDRGYGNLVYFEYTQAQAEEFLRGGRQA